MSGSVRRVHSPLLVGVRVEADGRRSFRLAEHIEDRHLQRREEVERVVRHGSRRDGQTARLVESELLANGVEHEVFGQRVGVSVIRLLSVLTRRRGLESDRAAPRNQQRFQVLRMREDNKSDRSLGEAGANALREFLPHARNRHEEGRPRLLQRLHERAAQRVGTRHVHRDAIANRHHRVRVLRSDVVHGEERHEAVLVVQLQVVANIRGLTHAAVMRTHYALRLALPFTHLLSSTVVPEV